MNRNDFHSTKFFLLQIVILLSFVFVQGQSIETKLVAQTELNAEQFLGADELGSLFFIQNQVFYKKSQNRMFSFSNVDLGEISQVDVTNPFKILLFYKDFNSVIILDNNLNELSERIDFTQETLFNNVLFVSNSSANNIWLYADDNKLHLYNYQLLSEEVQTQATTFYQSDFLALNLVSTFKNVWIQSEKEVLQFNEYGNFVQSYDLNGAEMIFPFQKGLVTYSKGIYKYQTKDSSNSIVVNHAGAIKNISLSGSSIFIYDGKTVFQYEMIP